MTAFLQKLLVLLVALLPGLAHGHRTEIEQVLLTELGKGRYSIRYSAPPPGMSEFAAPVLPPHCRWVEEREAPVRETSTSLVFESPGRPLSAEDSIILPWERGGVLVEAQWADGSTGRQFFMSEATGILVRMDQLQAGSGSSWAGARRYTWLGVEHILSGVDHLLFVAGLLLLVRGARKLVATITAFTLAHSLTLGLAAVGWVRLPSGPVEALIALSILLLAAENVYQQRGRAGLASTRPWLVSFFFGLVHGLGFAGALGEMGLPKAEIPLALLFFNLGVEGGQLFFVGCWFALYAAARLARLPTMPHLQVAAHYALGAIAAWWTLQRVVAIFVPPG
jgi:hypothetical protein